MVTGEIAETLDFIPDIHTYCGHPAAAAAALAAIGIYEDEGLVDRAREQGESMLAALRRFEDIEIVGEVRGIGMWAAVDFTSDRATRASPDPEVLKQVVARARELGVLVSRNGTCVEVAPPLVIPQNTLEDGIARFESAVRDVAATVA